jgi:hypothetical protein
MRSLGIAAVLALVVSGGFLLGAKTARDGASPIPECTGTDSLDVGCFAARYEALTRVSGVERALSDLAERRETSGHLGSACHQLAHVVGRTAGQIHGGAAFTRGSELCSSGYYHGVVEAVMMNIGAAKIIEQARGVCAEYRSADDRPYLYYNCIHGMGHGFMGVFGSDVLASLKGCDALPDRWEQRHCAGGVFMENLSAILHHSRPSKYLRPTEPLYPCTAVAERYKEECYLEQTAYALYVRNDDYVAVFRLCRDEADEAFRAACYEGIGGDATIMSSKYVSGLDEQVEKVRQLCLLGPDDGARASCVVGAVKTIVADLGGEDRKARAVCAVLAPLLAEACETARQDAHREMSTGRHAHLH